MVGERPDSLGKAIEVAFLHPHGGERFLEGCVTKEVERNIGFPIDGIAGTEDDAMKTAIGVIKFALGVVGMDDRDE